MSDAVPWWELFREAYLGGILLSGLLGLIGVFLVARSQVFLGAAVAQASTLGVAIALVVADLHFFGVHFHGNGFARGLAIACSAAAALLMEALPSRREQREAANGVVLLLCAAGSLVVTAHSPFSAHEVLRLMTSTVLGATAADALVVFALLLVSVGIVALHGDRFFLIALDPQSARAIGLSTAKWNSLWAMWLAVTVGICIHVAGWLHVFGFLVLPPFVAHAWSRGIRHMLWLSPAVGILGCTLGFAIAHWADLPPSPISVLLLGGLIGGSWLVKRISAAATNRAGLARSPNTPPARRGPPRGDA